MTLQDKLAAIVWPAPYEAHLHLPSLRHIAEGRHRDDQLGAALALLAVCLEWITATGVHQDPCLKDRDVYEHPCVCGLDALCAKLEAVMRVAADD